MTVLNTFMSMWELEHVTVIHLILIQIKLCEAIAPKEMTMLMFLFSACEGENWVYRGLHGNWRESEHSVTSKSNIVLSLCDIDMTTMTYFQVCFGGIPNKKNRHNLPFRNKITIKIQKFDHM